MELLVFGALFVVLFTPASMLIARRAGALDMPDGERKMHAYPTPRLGGLALFFGIMAAGLLFLPSSPIRAAWIAGGALLCVLGVSDDIFSLSAPTKLLAELAIATLAVAFELSPEALTVAGFSVALSPWVASTVTVLWIMLLSNAFNLIDGLDMLSVTQGIIASAFLALAVTPYAWLLLGALLGFLPYNRTAMTVFPVRRTRTRSFLGDTGALFLGYSLAILSLGTTPEIPLLLPLVFLVPIAELAFSFFRRAVRGKNPFLADRGHFHHKLLARGYSAPMAVLLLMLFAALSASLFVLSEPLLTALLQ
jgi:UDP-GlcNAc:undecaprenyl-phosphate GlcNAc-1-phosphate transferase